MLADAGNGAAAPLDLRHWLRVNTELTVHLHLHLHLHRPPVAEWMAVAARTVVGPTGMGTVSGLLFDEQGHAGRSTQSVVVRPR